MANHKDAQKPHSPESFTITPELRYQSRFIFHDNHAITNKDILQQKWKGSYGSEKWEDVPTVKE